METTGLVAEYRPFWFVFNGPFQYPPPLSRKPGGGEDQIESGSIFCGDSLAEERREADFFVFLASIHIMEFELRLSTVLDLSPFVINIRWRYAVTTRLPAA